MMFEISLKSDAAMLAGESSHQSIVIHQVEKVQSFCSFLEFLTPEEAA